MWLDKTITTKKTISNNNNNNSPKKTKLSAVDKLQLFNEGAPAYMKNTKRSSQLQQR